MPAMHRVLVTGMGPISPVGIGREDFWQGLDQGRDGRLPPQLVPAPPQAVTMVAECLDFVVEDYLSSEKTYLDRCSEMVLAACSLAFDDAGLDWSALDGELLGLAVGTAYGCLDSMANVTSRVQSKGVRFASPMIFTHSFTNSPVSLAAIEYGVRGPAAALCTGDTSAGAALQYALDLVRWGRAEVMLAGGADALSASLLQALDATGPHRDVTPGEGACLFVLESEKAARRRGANILAELLDVALSDSGQAAIGLEQAGHTLERYSTVETYGHTFGASLALELAEAMRELPTDPSAAGYIVTVDDPGGRSAAAAVRRYH